MTLQAVAAAPDLAAPDRASCRRTRMSSLNPVMRIGTPAARDPPLPLRARPPARSSSGRRAARAGRHPRPAAPPRRATRTSCPAGMRQRVAIAMAIAVRARPADRRRADHRPRRHRAGADPRPAASPAARAEHGDDLRLPRPRRRRRPGRRDRRDVRRADRRAGARREARSHDPRMPYSEALLALEPHASTSPERPRWR